MKKKIVKQKRQSKNTHLTKALTEKKKKEKEKRSQQGKQRHGDVDQNYWNGPILNSLSKFMLQIAYQDEMHMAFHIPKDYTN